MKRSKQLVLIVWVVIAAIFMMPKGVTGDGKEQSGKDLFKMNCKVCHEKDSANGEYTPMTLTQDQWKAFFKNKFAVKHKDVVLARENKKLLEYLTPKNIETIQKYVVDHAADSEQPQTCSE